MRRHFSLERLFADVRDSLPADISCRVATSRYESRGLFKRIYNILEARRRQTDVNHITGDVHYLALLISPRSTVLTILDCVCLDRHRGWRQAVLRWLWFELPTRRAAVVTTISAASKREILKYTTCPPDKIRVIPCCVSPAFRPAPRTFNADCPTILQIGTAPNKNIERLAAALAGVRCRLRIVGTLAQPQADAIRTAGIDCVVSERLTDEEIVEAYAAADIVSLVSTYEGFGLPIVEANAVGRPVVTANLSSMPEVAGDAACLVDPYDIAAIRAGFQRVIDDASYRDALVAAGHRNAARFSRETVAREYAAVYRALALGTGAAGQAAEGAVGSCRS
jgi:glycosyltransferase involved in cell wall biosynthesis